MNNLFGTGRILPGLGFLAAASPASVPPPLLAAGLAWNDNIKAFRAEAGGSGQSGASLAAAVGLINTLRTNRPMAVPVPEPGRANVLPAADICRARTASAAGPTIRANSAWRWGRIRASPTR